ncbi:MAG: chromophore lyase CpcT/CpeT [Xanthomonadales bacterium]|nr:chromophore lyase CpcT/CpeT [Xanthomonadales bacterium]
MRAICWMMAALLAGFLAMGSAAAETPLDKDLKTFMAMFPGEYDNNNQVMFAEEAGVPEDSRHERLHHYFVPVEMPALGDHIVFVQQYIHNDPTNVYRVRLYRFTADYEENAIRLAIFRPSDAAAITGAHEDPGLLDKVGPDDFVNLPGCDVFWVREADHFRGYMKPGACTIKSRRDGRIIVIDDDLLLTRDQIWISDRAEYEDGSYAFGNKAGIPHKNTRVRHFQCWVAIQHQDSDQWFFKPAIALHDQGGVEELVTDEETPRTFYLRMARPVWPSGNNKPSTVVYVHGQNEDGSMGDSISYSWGAYDAERVGINLKMLNLQASCSLKDSM